MKIIYIPEDFHLIVNHLTQTLCRKYERTSEIYLNTPSYFEAINIIISIEKDEIQISSLFNYDLSRFNIVETPDNYYISMGLYTLSYIIYKCPVKTDFSELLAEKLILKFMIPNIFDYVSTTKFFKDQNKHSLKSVEYSHRYLDVLGDMYNINEAYMTILNKSSDLDRVDLNKLFRINARYLIPINRLIEIQTLKGIITFNNDYNFYKDRFYDFTELSTTDMSQDNIIQYLNCISKNDRYTNNNVSVEFKTSITNINKFTQNTARSYRQSISNVMNILPMSTLADMFMSATIHDINRYSSTNEEMSHLKDLLLFKNNYMDFAFHGNKEEDNND